MPRPRIILPLLVVAAAALLPACLINSDRNVEQRGQFVGPETLSKIEPGRGKDFVLALLGEPSSRSKLEDGSEIWRWSYSEVTSSETGVIFVLGSKSSREKQGVVFVEFEDGLATRAWRD